MRLTKVQRELLGLLASGPRYGFTDFRAINALVSKKLARKAGSDFYITAAGKKLVGERPRFDQRNSQDDPGFVEAFRVSP
jgi:hypothetical protein